MSRTLEHEINAPRTSASPETKPVYTYTHKPTTRFSDLTNQIMSHSRKCRSSYVRYMCGHETPLVISRGIGCRSCARTGYTCITPPPIRVLKERRCHTCRQRRNGDGSRGRRDASSRRAFHTGNSVRLYSWTIPP